MSAEHTYDEILHTDGWKDRLSPEEIDQIYEAAEFAARLDHEGGTLGLLYHSGTENFPASILWAAQAFSVAADTLDDAISNYFHRIGISY